ncbi:preprotein translocase subunit SecG [Robiginitalea myxolifaciens]|uniref:Protein-export membrane protein SecG n=1 Tax=Robiginitalea myxolifaciens TaxID=400055 RepID=A0A1I6GB81_9FLAO|nr:preprotein translocase subunit SecG [Robiginitalea myxolifaciens]SFR39439.1 preprotein translocase subunit SecG [Robiginitalea myxolifaciens]
MDTFNIFLILIIVVCLLLMLVVMVQNPKGGGLSSSFGGGGTQIVGGVKKTGDFLDKSTWTLATVLIVLILLSNVALKSNFAASESRLLQEDGIESVPQGELDEIPVEPAAEPATTIDTIQ